MFQPTCWIITKRLSFLQDDHGWGSVQANQHESWQCRWQQDSHTAGTATDRQQACVVAVSVTWWPSAVQSSTSPTCSPSAAAAWCCWSCWHRCHGRTWCSVSTVFVRRWRAGCWAPVALQRPWLGIGSELSVVLHGWLVSLVGSGFSWCCWCFWSAFFLLLFSLFLFF